MIRKYLFISVAASIAIYACSSTRVKPILEPQSKIDQIISGKILDIHILGKITETVIVCHFDPQYVVSIQTEDGVKNIAIHSPAKLLIGTESVGRYYRFYLSKANKHFMIEKIEEIKNP